MHAPYLAGIGHWSHPSSGLPRAPVLEHGNPQERTGGIQAADRNDIPTATLRAGFRADGFGRSVCGTNRCIAPVGDKGPVGQRQVREVMAETKSDNNDQVF